MYNGAYIFNILHTSNQLCILILMPHLPNVIAIQNMPTNWISEQQAQGQKQMPHPMSTLPDELSRLKRVAVARSDLDTSRKRNANTLEQLAQGQEQMPHPMSTLPDELSRLKRVAVARSDLDTSRKRNANTLEQLAQGQGQMPHPMSTLPDELSRLKRVAVARSDLDTSRKRNANTLDAELDTESYAESGAEPSGMERFPSSEAYANYPETPERGPSAEPYVLDLELIDE